VPFANLPLPGELQVNLQKGILERLRAALPEPMVPAHIVLLDEMPLTPNGKLDRKALPAPDASVIQAQYVAPRNDTEEKLAGIWREVLKLDRVGIDDNFFDLGGHSLLAVRLHGMLAQSHGRGITIVDLFQFPTVRKLAQALDGAHAETRGAATQGIERAQGRRQSSQRRAAARHRRNAIDQAQGES
jgi:acyl carrier protein